MPYLEPASMQSALNDIEMSAPRICRGLINYVRTQYVGNANTRPRYSPDEWSVYTAMMNGSPRTNNAQESFHAKFNETANADNLAGRKVKMSKSIATLKMEEENVRQLCLASSIQAAVSRGARRTASQQRDDAIKAALVSGQSLIQIMDAIVTATAH